MTLAELAKATDLSPGYLSQVERGIADPSLSSLQRIADALSIPAMLLLENPTNNKPLTIPRDKQPIVSIPASASVKYRLMTPLPSSEYVPNALVLEFTLEPKSQDFKSPIYHNCEEIVIVISGEMTVVQMGSETVLRAGDTMTLLENTPHHFVNKSDEAVTGYSIMSPAIWSLSGQHIR